jgi:hypothetical protein
MMSEPRTNSTDDARWSVKGLSDTQQKALRLVANGTSVRIALISPYTTRDQTWDTASFNKLNEPNIGSPSDWPTRSSSWGPRGFSKVDEAFIGVEVNRARVELPLNDLVEDHMLLNGRFQANRGGWTYNRRSLERGVIVDAEPLDAQAETMVQQAMIRAAERTAAQASAAGASYSNEGNSQASTSTSFIESTSNSLPPIIPPHLMEVPVVSVSPYAITTGAVVESDRSFSPTSTAHSPSPLPEENTDIIDMGDSEFEYESDIDV